MPLPRGIACIAPREGHCIAPKGGFPTMPKFTQSGRSNRCQTQSKSASMPGGWRPMNDASTCESESPLHRSTHRWAAVNARVAYRTRTARAVAMGLSSVAVMTIGANGTSITPSKRKVTRHVTVRVTCFVPGLA